MIAIIIAGDFRQEAVVSSIIEGVLEKNGEVIMVENGVLQDYKGMALITRY